MIIERRAAVRARAAIVFLVALLTVLSGCGRDDSKSEVLGATSSAFTTAVLAVTPPKSKVPPTVQQVFQATVSEHGEHGKSKTLTSGVEWSVSDPTVAAVSASGVVTALKAGVATVRAKETASGVSGTATFTVTSAALVSMALTPPVSKIAVASSVTLKATGTFSDGTNFPLLGAVTWTTTNATIATVDATGKVTGIAPGTVLITATHTATGTTAKTLLTVGRASLTSVAVTPSTRSLAMGTVQTFVAMGTYSDGTKQDLTSVALWSSSAPTVAKVSNDVGTRGTATALLVGTTTINATVGGTTGSSSVTVTRAILTAIAVTPSTKSLPNGTTQKLKATGSYGDGTTQDLSATVTWTSSSAAAVVSNASGSNGLVTAMAVGAATITAKDPVSGVAGSATMTVTAAVVRSLAITPPAANTPLGKSVAFRATAIYSDGTTGDLTSSVTWSSGAEAATVSNDPVSAGVATPAKVGATIIEAFDPTSGIFASASFDISPASLVSIAITPPAKSLPRGLTQQLAATGTYTDGTTHDLTATATWSSSAASFVVSNAPGSAGRGTADGTGVATITALDPGSGIAGSTTVSVTPAILVSLAMMPSAPTLPLGTSQQLTATGTYTDGSNVDLTTTVTWTTSSDVVSLTSTAASTSVGAGHLGIATITATAAAEGVSCAGVVTVTPAALVSIAVSPDTASVASGLSVQLSATGTYTDGTTADLTSSATWSSFNESAKVSNAAGTQGLVVAGSVGIATITALDPTTGVNGRAALTATRAQLVSIDLSPPAANLPAGSERQLTATGRYTDGSVLDLTKSVTWSASASYAAVSNAMGSNGLLTAIGAGPVTITATDPTTTIAASTSLDVTVFVGPPGAPGTPVFASISPDVGDTFGGARVVLTLASASSVTGVTFGGADATDVVQIDSTHVSCVAPARAAGFYEIKSSNELGAGNVLVGAYEAWSPIVDYPAARVFQSDQGVTTSQETTMRTRTGLVADLSTTGFIARDGAPIVKLASGRLLMLGGWHTAAWGPSPAGDRTNEILYSDDLGRSWATLLANDPAPPTEGEGARFLPGHTTAVFVHTVRETEYVYWIGAEANAASARDGGVWRSSDGGSTWARISTAAPTAGTSLFMFASFAGNIYIFGGQTDLRDPKTALQTVYRSSDDGVTWTQLPDAPWAPRGAVYSPCVYSGVLWLIGGGTYASLQENRTFYNDVWTFDGATWTEILRDGHQQFTGRHYHSMLAHDGRLWILNGYTRTSVANGEADAYSTTDGIRWTRANDVVWYPTHAAGAVSTSQGILTSQGITNESLYLLEDLVGPLASAWLDQGSGGLALQQSVPAAQPVLAQHAFGDLPGMSLLGTEFMRLASYDRDVPAVLEEYVVGRTNNVDAIAEGSSALPPSPIIGCFGDQAYNEFGMTGDSLAYTDGAISWRRIDRGSGLADNRTRLFGVEHRRQSLKLFVGLTQQGSTRTDIGFDSRYTGWDSVGTSINYNGEAVDFGKFVLGGVVVLKLEAPSSPLFRTKLNKWAMKWVTAL